MISAWRTHLRSVSVLIPSRVEIAFIAAHSVSYSSRCSRTSRTALVLTFRSYLLDIVPSFPEKKVYTKPKAVQNFSRYAIPQPLLVDIVDTMARYGRLRVVKHPAHGLCLLSLDHAVLAEVLRNKKITPMLGARVDDDTVLVHPSERGRVKQMLLKIGWRPRIWPATSMARPIRSAWRRMAGNC